MQRRIVWGGLFLVLAISPTSARPVIAAPEPAPLFTGKQLPQPPQQGTDWTPPKSSLSPEWTVAVQRLLKLGFADPRGCEYREVSVVCGSVWSNRGGVTTTHAWVLPIPEDAYENAQRFAVSWSGLVYPCVRVGDVADLAADVTLQLQAPADRFQPLAQDEATWLSWNQPRLLKGVLLLVLGEADLAQKVWEHSPPDLRWLRKETREQRTDPYPSLLRDWAIAVHDRALCAHLRGDDVIALSAARQAQSLKNAAETQLRELKFQPREDSLRRPVLFLDFLIGIDALTADQERRARLAPVVRVFDPEAPRLTDQNARITALIRDLEVVDATQMSQPGAVHVLDDKRPISLIAEGPAAVEPLLDCLLTDNRLTLSVQFGRDFSTHRQVLPVTVPAFRALQQIAKAESFGPLTEKGRGQYIGNLPDEQRRAAVMEIREYWNKAKKLSEADRWFQILADDNATDKQWLEAARFVTSRGRINPAAPDTARPFQGEELRNRKNPGVADLLSRRADQIADQDHFSSRRISRLLDACILTACQADWQLESALPDIRKRITQVRELDQNQNFRGHSGSLHAPLARLIMIAVDGGRTEFLDDYVDWMENLQPHSNDHDSWGKLRPLARYPNDRRVVSLAQKLFAPASDWMPLENYSSSAWAQGYSSPLVSVPAFREAIGRELLRTEIFGKGNLNTEEAKIDIRYQNEFRTGGLGQVVRPAFDDDARQVTEDFPVRWCDLVAWKLSFLPGAPVFEVWWSEERRNKTLPEMKAFLDHWGPAYRDRAPLTAEFISTFSRTTFQIDSLTVTATADDVAAARAIFSLEDVSEERRVVELPQFPQHARWKTLDRFPINHRQYDPDTNRRSLTTKLDQTGQIWQAEEAKVDGRWQRYYGFIGRHIITRVPADEIEFLRDPLP